MRFQRNIKVKSGLDAITIVPLLDVLVQLLLFFGLAFSFTSQSGINIRLPKAITSDVGKEENFIITVTNEDIIYLNNHIVTIKELQKELGKTKMKSRPILIKADRRASLGRIVEVWDLCRNLGLEHINMATAQNR